MTMMKMMTWNMKTTMILRIDHNRQVLRGSVQNTYNKDRKNRRADDVSALEFFDNTIVKEIRPC